MATGETWDLLPVSLRPTTLEALAEMQFTHMTPVQAATIPLFMKNKDVAVEACTGSGKTLAFLIPVFEMLLKRHEQEPFKRDEVGAIIITPVRELATQISEVAQAFVSRLDGLSTLLLVGGASSTEDDLAQFKRQGGTVLIATPGRLEYVLRSSAVKLKQLEVLVLDEADRLLDMGFQASLNTILQLLPKQRRTGLFSATQTDELKELIRAGLRNPVRVAVKVENRKTKAVQKIPSELSNFYTLCEPEQKLAALMHFLSEHREAKLIVYFLTCSCVDYFYRVLTDMPQLRGVRLLSLHGKVPHAKRTKVLERFNGNASGVLLATDVASRGLDFPDVDWIVQFDPPQDPATFVHRIGRTARMGRQGQALVYLLPSEDTYIEFLSLRRVPIHRLELPSDKLPEVLPLVRARAAKSRELFDKAQIAFVSYIRAYKEHHCSYIFRLENLDVGALASAFGLLILPKMPELRGRSVAAFVPSDVDIDTIPYADLQQERKRLKNLEEFKAKKAKEKEKQGKKDAKKEKKRKMREERQKDAQTSGKTALDYDDLEELANEARLLKKLKRRKISERQFQLAVGELEPEEEQDDEDNVAEDDDHTGASVTQRPAAAASPPPPAVAPAEVEPAVSSTSRRGRTQPSGVTATAASLAASFSPPSAPSSALALDASAARRTLFAAPAESSLSSSQTPAATTADGVASFSPSALADKKKKKKKQKGHKKKVPLLVGARSNS